LGAVTGAVNKLSVHILGSYTDACIDEASIEYAKVHQRIENLTKTMITILRK